MIAAGNAEIGHVSAGLLDMGEGAPDVCAVRDGIARRVQDGTEGRWLVWYGHRTGRYWATPTWPGANRLVEARTLDDLRAVMGEVDAFYSTRR